MSERLGHYSDSRQRVIYNSVSDAVTLSASDRIGNNRLSERLQDMDIESPCWEEYENRFMELANTAQLVDRPEPSLDKCRFYLFLYGENGMNPDDELEFLDQIAQAQKQGSPLKKMEVETDYWQDIVLFIP